MTAGEHNQLNPYDADCHVAEIYDQCVTGLEDVSLIRKLIAAHGPLEILEPFCGTGRILIPLALDGHFVHGIDQAKGMLHRAQQKAQQLSPGTHLRIQLTRGDAITSEWPLGFDLVILGGNCFYELATPEEQETCILQAFQALKSGGHLFIDNDHMEGNLADSWQDIGVVSPSLCGQCSDGTLVESTRETIWFDVPDRLARFRRRTKVTLPDGSIIEQETIQQKHPVGKGEVQGWLEKHGFTIEEMVGNHDRAPYDELSPRAIFWARKG